MIASREANIDIKDLTAEAAGTVATITGACLAWNEESADGNNITGFRKKAVLMVVDDQTVNIKMLRMSVKVRCYWPTTGLRLSNC